MKVDGDTSKSHDGVPDMIRIDLKLYPNNTKVNVPGDRAGDKPFDMTMWRKPVVFKKKNEPDWNIGMCRAPANHDMEFDRSDDIDYCFVIMQEPKYWIDVETDEVTDVCFKAVSNQVLKYREAESICYDKGRAMSKSQSKKFEERVKDLERAEIAKTICLKAQKSDDVDFEMLDDYPADCSPIDRAVVIVDSETRNVVEEKFPEAKIIDVGVDGKEVKDKKFMARILEAVEVEKPSLMFSFFGAESEVDQNAVTEYFEFLDLISGQGIGILHIDSIASPRWNETIEMESTDCRGDLSFITNVPEVREEILRWSWNKRKSYLPKSVDHIPDANEDFGKVLKKCYELSDVHKLAETCFVVEKVEDRRDVREDINEGVIDEPEEPKEGE